MYGLHCTKLTEKRLELLLIFKLAWDATGMNETKLSRKIRVPKRRDNRISQFRQGKLLFDWPPAAVRIADARVGTVACLHHLGVCQRSRGCRYISLSWVGDLLLDCFWATVRITDVSLDALARLL